MKLDEAISHMEKMLEDSREAEEMAYMEYIDDPGDDWAENSMRKYRKDIEAMRTILDKLKERE